jgi:hypothetical protein
MRLEKNNDLFGICQTILKDSKVLHQDITSLWEGKHLKASQTASNRTHIIISRQEELNPQGCFVVNSMEKAIEMCPQDEVRSLLAEGKFINWDLIVRQNRTYISTS